MAYFLNIGTAERRRKIKALKKWLTIVANDDSRTLDRNNRHPDDPRDIFFDSAPLSGAYTQILNQCDLFLNGGNVA